MMTYSVQPRYQKFVKDYGFLSFSKIWLKNLSGKYNQKLLDNAKQSATDAFQIASKRAI